jgi:hypothetical protein
MVLAEGRATDHPLVATDQSMTFDHAIVAAHPRLTAVKGFAIMRTDDQCIARPVRRPAPDAERRARTSVNG